MPATIARIKPGDVLVIEPDDYYGGITTLALRVHEVGFHHPALEWLGVAGLEVGEDQGATRSVLVRTLALANALKEGAKAEGRRARGSRAGTGIALPSTRMADLRALPKANLHLHLTGAMRPATLAELAARAGLTPPPPLPAGTANGWAAFQTRYDAARAALRTAADLARVVAEAAADDAADGCGWVELQVDPTSYEEKLGGPDAVVEAVLTGAAAAPIPVGVIVASSWAGPPERALALAGLAARYAGRGVVGFGLSNDERRGRVADFVPACRLAGEAGLVVAPHAGFYEPASHVRDCVDLLDAGRIGHGVTALASARTLELLADRGVALEVCPTSYPPFGVVADLAALRLRDLLAAGVPVALGTDDPLLFGVGLAGQYGIARDVLGCADADLAALARHSVAASAAPEPVRARLLAGVDAWLS